MEDIESNFEVTKRNIAWDFTTDEEQDHIKYKCPDFPYCKVVTPFSIRLQAPEDMEHFLRYHN